MSKVRVVVPARLASSRLPRKPLALIGDKPMIVWVAERAKIISADDLVIAVDDEEVLGVVEEYGFEGVLTSTTHRSGSDRVMEVARLKNWSAEDILINVQGDEPLLSAEVVDELIRFMKENKKIEFATISEPITEVDDFINPNCVKVVTDNAGVALYFSRAAIPYPRENGDLSSSDRSERQILPAMNYPIKRHVGIYGFRVEALEDFVSLDESALEEIEKLEQLRWLEAGRKIHLVHSSIPLPGGVDTPEDLIRVRSLLLSDQE